MCLQNEGGSLVALASLFPRAIVNIISRCASNVTSKDRHFAFDRV